MADQKSPTLGTPDVGQAQIAPAVSAVMTQEMMLQQFASMQQLIQLLLSERQDDLEARKARAAAILEREKQRKINAEYQIKEKANGQSMCSHKKGGRRGPKSPKIDYAVYYHTFTDSSSYIRCQICGMTWKPQDTPEFLVRGGVQVPNHTGIGWKEAYGFLGQSTNTPSASEVMLAARPAVSPSAQ